jgi:cyclopropane fatty-acyl-phospholipid synthase-like methyltransferase
VLDLRAAYRAWASFRGAGPATRAFLLARLVNAPLGPLDDDLRALRGRVLSLGAGYGLIERYLTELNPGVVVDGVELDESRVAAAAASPAERVTVRRADVRSLPESGTYSAALAIDVLHHVPAGEHGGIAAALRDALEPGGVCLVKDIATTPRWKHAWNRTHDRLVAGPDPLHCRSPQDMASVFEAEGLEITGVRRLSPASPYPHYLVRAQRPRG